MRKNLQASLIVLIFCILICCTGCYSLSEQKESALEGVVIDSIGEKDYERGISEALLYLEDNGDDSTVLQLLLNLYILNEDINGAAEVAQKLSTISDETSPSWSILYGQLLIDSQESERALSLYEHLYDEDPLEKDYVFPLIDLYIDNGEYQIAYDIALELYHHNVEDADVIGKIIEIGEVGGFDWVESYRSILEYL